MHRLWRHPLGEVSSGTDATTGARVHVLTFNAGSVITDSQLEAARQAARVAAGISNSAIVRPVDVQRLADGRIAVATEPFEGTPLTNVSRNQPLPPGRVVGLLRQMCKVLASIHDVGLSHRALTLGSLVLRARADRPDAIIVTDFGVGPLLDGDVVVQKEDAAVQPVTPERTSGVVRDVREDLYLLGCLAYALFTGGPPFRTGTPDAVRRRHAIEDPMAIADRMKGTRPIAPALAAWVHRCLAKEPDDRFEDAVAAEAALCLAQLEAHVATPWDDLPVPEVDSATAEKIRAGFRRPSAHVEITRFSETEEDVTIAREAPSDDMETVVRIGGYEPPVQRIDEEVHSIAIGIGQIDSQIDGQNDGQNDSEIDRGEIDQSENDRSETVVTRVEDTVAGAIGRNEATTVQRAPVEPPPRANEETQRSAIPSEETSVDRAPVEDTHVGLGPVAVPDLDFDAELDLGDRTQVASMPVLPFKPAPIVSFEMPDDEPDAGDRTIVGPRAVVTFSPGIPGPPSSTPTIPAGASIDPALLQSSTSTLPGSAGRTLPGAGDSASPVLQPMSERPPAPPSISPPVIAAPQMPPAPVIAAPVLAPPVLAPPVFSPPVIAPPVIAPEVIAPVIAAPVAPSIAPPVFAPVVSAPDLDDEPITEPPFGAPPFGAPPFGAPPFGAPPFGAPPFGAPASAEPVAAPPIPAPPIAAPAPPIAAQIPTPPIAAQIPTPPAAAPPIAASPPAPPFAGPFGGPPAAPPFAAPSPSPFAQPAPIPAAMLPPSAVPPGMARPWPESPTGLTGQFTSANASMTDLDASMIASIGGGGRTIKLIVGILLVAGLVGGGVYLAMRPPAEAPKVAQPEPEAPPPPPLKAKPTTSTDDIAADVAATPSDLASAGDRALGEGRTADAEAFYQRAIVREPKHLASLLGLGRVQLVQGDVEKAASYFRRAVGASPDDGGARIALGDALVKQGNVAEAKKQYRKAKSLKHPDAAGRLSSL